MLLPVNLPVSVVAPVAADTAFGNTFDFATLIATYTGPDVAIVGNIIVQNHSELMQHFLLLILFLSSAATLTEVVHILLSL